MSLIPQRSSVAARRVLGIVLSGAVTVAIVGVGLSPSAYARTVRLKKPGAVTGVTAQPIDQGAVVTWGPPASDGGSQITGYLVQVGDDTRTVTCTTTTATTCTVTGLMDGRQHRAKVRAINAVGQGKVSLSGKFTPGQSPDCSNLVPGANLEYCPLNQEDVSLAGLDLAGADFWGAKLEGENFTGADLAGALFGGNTQAQADLSSAIFSGANLTGATLDGTYLYTTTFNGANLTDASFAGATLIFVNFSDANLTGSDLNQADLLQSPSWSDTICPDGTNSDSDGNTCADNLG
jgi:hypothetical protein